MNTSADIWGSDAAEFVPERWLGPRKAQTEANYNLTFLDGPRGCIGQGFARSELKCAVAALVGSFVMELKDANQPVTIKGTVLERPEPLNIRIRAAAGW